ncbi:MAG: ABC transporter permease, partial [Bacteroidaceae bacterium]|nr:ABC transporter permease [Bacteroidaceae bacterium]
AREHNAFRHLIPIDKHHTGLLRIVFGKAAAYLLIYIPIAVYVFGVVPHMFSLNQIGSPIDLLLFLIPYIIACIFFAMTVSGLVRHRETSIILVVFSSVPLLFISGVSWPGSAIPELWRPLSYVFPSTFGINGFVRINNSAATLSQVQNEWFALWLQAIAYFFLSAVVYRRSIRSARCNVAQHWRALRSRKTEQALHTP